MHRDENEIEEELQTPSSARKVIHSRTAGIIKSPVSSPTQTANPVVADPFQQASTVGEISSTPNAAPLLQHHSSSFLIQTPTIVKNHFRQISERLQQRNHNFQEFVKKTSQVPQKLIQRTLFNKAAAQHVSAEQNSNQLEKRQGSFPISPRERDDDFDQSPSFPVQHHQESKDQQSEMEWKSNNAEVIGKLLVSGL